jgi:2-amino-4-hydroxy-6-hydroxymethyldihydropteridine diphosphokinase
MILKKIEEDLGRIKNIKWGPRIIDIDILFYSDKIIRQKNIIIPHKK